MTHRTAGSCRIFGGNGPFPAREFCIEVVTAKQTKRHIIREKVEDEGGRRLAFVAMTATIGKQNPNTKALPNDQLQNIQK
jgi:hypothetical protein